jgi:hypothetical protein
MSACRKQAMIDAPVEAIWELVGDPRRHPEWWPRIIEIDGRRFEEGDEYVLVARGSMGSTEARWLIEQKEDLREIHLRCQLTGTYARWHMTGAQGGTFVDLEIGMDPKALSYKIFDSTIGPRYFRRWADQSLEALGEASATSSPAAGAAAGSA